MASHVGAEVWHLFRLAWPQTISNFTGFAPKLFMLAAVGHLPEDAAIYVGAAGIGSMYSNFAHLMLIRSSTFGAASLLSQAFGAANHTRVGLMLMRVLVIHCLLMVCLSLPLTLAAGPLLAAVGQPATVARAAQQFVWVRLLGLPGTTVLVDLTTFLNAQRCVRMPMVVSILGSFLQVGLAFLLTSTLGFVGAPLAMTIVELLQGALMLLLTPWLLRRHNLRSWPHWRRDWRQALRGWKEVLQRGAPASAMIISEWLGWECTLFVASGLCDASSDSCAVVEAIPICTTVMVCEFILVFGWRKCHRHCNSHPMLHNQTPAQPADLLTGRNVLSNPASRSPRHLQPHRQPARRGQGRRRQILLGGGLVAHSLIRSGYGRSGPALAAPNRLPLR